MDVSNRPVAERIARVLAGQRISINAEGTEESASPQVEQVWREYLPDAVAVLKTLREPDERMAAAGDVATVLGPGTEGEPTVKEWAGWAHTIEHEIVTGIGARVRRRPTGTAA